MNVIFTIKVGFVFEIINPNLIPAKNQLIWYILHNLLSQEKYFRLENINTPKILVRNILDYDVVQKISLVLHVQVQEGCSSLLPILSPLFRSLTFISHSQDTFNGSASDEPFFTSVAMITVQVRDVDNRPPWFQPCLRTNLGIAKLCVSSGYRGKVNLTEKEASLFHKQILEKLMQNGWYKLVC